MAHGAEVSILAMFSGELRRARGRAGLTQEQLADRIGYSASLIAHVEAGSRAPSTDFAARCDGALGTDGLLTRLQPLVRSEAYPAWFRDWVEIEREASMLRSYEPLVVPGLLQTANYAAAVLQAANPSSSNGEVERLVAARMDRQSILAKQEPPLLWAIVDEGVLTRPVSGPAVMRGQLEHLIHAARQTKVILQVVPTSTGAHPGLAGAFMIAGFDGSSDIAYLDNAVAGQVTERPADLFRVNLLYDMLKAEALSPRASAQFLGKAIERWT